MPTGEETQASYRRPLGNDIERMEGLVTDKVTVPYTLGQSGGRAMQHA
jgi:hypothetical protein